MDNQQTSAPLPPQPSTIQEIYDLLPISQLVQPLLDSAKQHEQTHAALFATPLVDSALAAATPPLKRSAPEDEPHESSAAGAVNGEGDGEREEKRQKIQVDEQPPRVESFASADEDKVVVEMERSGSEVEHVNAPVVVAQVETPSVTAPAPVELAFAPPPAAVVVETPAPQFVEVPAVAVAPTPSPVFAPPAPAPVPTPAAPIPYIIAPAFVPAAASERLPTPPAPPVVFEQPQQPPQAQPFLEAPAPPAFIPAAIPLPSPTPLVAPTPVAADAIPAPSPAFVAPLPTSPIAPIPAAPVTLAPITPVAGFDPSAFAPSAAQYGAPIYASVTGASSSIGANPSSHQPGVATAPFYEAAQPSAAPSAQYQQPTDAAVGGPSQSLAYAPAPIIAGEGPIAVFTKEQQKFALSLLRQLKKNRVAPPFLRPVDPVALGIPDYFRVVTRPTDLGTIESKLNATAKAMASSGKSGRIYGVDYSGVGDWEGKGNTGSHYRTAAEFTEELQRVWENCYKYNGPKEKNPVSAMAGVLEEVAEKAFRTMPSAPAIDYKPEPPRQASPEIKKERKASPPSNAFVPTIRRSEDGTRPKREIVAPARELAYYAEQGEGGSRSRGRVSNKTSQDQLRFCKEVIKELFKKTHEAYAFVFYEPVNYVALNIPQYPSIVKKPIDLGTIRQKLEGGRYPMPPFDAFEADMRLLFKNCYLFNPPGSPVHEWGQKLEDVFNRKWDERPTGEDDDDLSDDDGISAMERQLQTMQANLAEMKAAKLAAKAQARAAERASIPRPPKPIKKASSSEVSRNRNTMSQIAKGRKGSSGGASKRRKSGGRRNEWSEDDDDEDIISPVPHRSQGHRQAQSEVVTFEMKRELAVKIVSFEGESLEKAIDIIRRGRPELLGDANKEIELDIDQLDQQTLLALYRFVCPPSPSRKPGKQTRGRAGTGGTKRKNLDEIKESERIEMLEKRLRDFENGGQQQQAGGPSPGMADQGNDDDRASSSSSGSGSESGSEESDED